MKMTESKSRAGTQSVERAFAILKTVGSATTRGIALGAIEKSVRLNRTTTYRLLKCLVRQGAVRFDAESSRYFLGPLAFELGALGGQQPRFKDILAPALTRIAEATGDTVFLILRSGNDSVCIDRRMGTYPVKTLVVEVGTRRPLGIGAASVAMLEAMPEAELQAVIRANTPRFAPFGQSAVSVLKAVRAARAREYVSERVPGIEGVKAVARPVIDTQERPVASIAVAAVTHRMSAARQPQLVQIVDAEIARVEAELRERAVEAKVY